MPARRRDEAFRDTALALLLAPGIDRPFPPEKLPRPGPRGEETASPTLKRRLPRTLFEERAHRALQVVGAEQRRPDLGRPLVGTADAVVDHGPHDPLRGRVRAGRAGGPFRGEAHRGFPQL